MAQVEEQHRPRLGDNREFACPCLLLVERECSSFLFHSFAWDPLQAYLG